MKTKQIFDIAVKNGYDFEGYLNKEYYKWKFVSVHEVRFYNKDNKAKGSLKLYEILFSQDFAQSIWGFGDQPDGISEVLNDGEVVCNFIPSWKFHLKYMVISDNPLQYLDDSLEGGEIK